MAWFLRAVEGKGGRWSCRWGALEYDAHEHLDHAVEHLRDLAAEFGTSVIFVHPARGAVQRLDPHEVRRLSRPSPESS